MYSLSPAILNVEIIHACHNIGVCHWGWGGGEREGDVESMLRFAYPLPSLCSPRWADFFFPTKLHCKLVSVWHTQISFLVSPPTFKNNDKVAPYFHLALNNCNKIWDKPGKVIGLNSISLEIFEMVRGYHQTKDSNQEPPSGAAKLSAANHSERQSISSPSLCAPHISSPGWQYSSSFRSNAKSMSYFNYPSVVLIQLPETYYW